LIMVVDSSVLDKESKKKLQVLNNKHVNAIIQKYTKLCKPKKVTVLSDSEEDISYIRELALKNNEEKKLATKGHTIHFDSINDQGRDLINTCVLVPKGKKLSKAIKTIEREKGLKEIKIILNNIMQGKEMLVKFYCLGPENSKFSIPALQLTDSSYVAHSEDILYRQGYEEFKRLKGANNFFHFIHSAGKLDNRNNSINIDKRRVYMDLEKERVFTVNNQYAGNSVGLKKLALRLAISKANKENWLCEHMFILGCHRKNRITYFTGAFPTACGKTSTAMIPGQTIIGDDIAYIHPDEQGFARAVNVEQGIFGIIKDVNPKDDPLIYKSLTTPRELIFSNVLINNSIPFWLGMGKDLPDKGENFSGNWNKDKKEILPAHKNARYTIRIDELDNADKNADNPEGVQIRGFIYGGRDSETCAPVMQTLSWPHGVFFGAALESETTTGTSEKEGKKKHNPMSNIEFLTVPLGAYINSHLKFGDALDNPPLIFATNYFLKENNNFLNEKTDKKAWLYWMEGRIHNEFSALETPIGFIPKYEDLKTLFKEIFNKEYEKKDYIKQFSIKIDNYLQKMQRIENIFKQEENIPEIFFQHLEQQKSRLKKAKKLGSIISPFKFEE